MNESIKLDAAEIQKLRYLLDANSINYKVRDGGRGLNVFGRDITYMCSMVI